MAKTEWTPKKVRHIWQSRTACVQYVIISGIPLLFLYSHETVVDFSWAIVGELE